MKLRQSNSPSSSRLDKLIEDTTKNAATAMTATMRIRQRVWNFWSLYRCFWARRWRMVPERRVSYTDNDA